MSYLVITTVGTSALDCDKVTTITDNGLRSWAATKDEEFNEDVRMERALGDEVARLFEAKVARNRLPAEIASLWLIRHHYQIARSDGSRFVFLSSQTAKGKSCAAAVAHAFRKIFPDCDCALAECPHVVLRCIEGVQHKDAQRFSQGVNVRLPAIIREEKTAFIAEHPGVEENMLFNFTGSYKGLIPFAAAHCTTYSFKMLYLFEDAKVLFLKEPNEAELIPLPDGA
jgi:hypothetical protein